MRTWITAVTFAAAAAAAAPVAGQAGYGSYSDAEQQAVRAVVEAFGAALAAGDAEAAVSHLHPELLVYESGYVERSAEEFAGEHLQADIEYLKAVRKDGVTRAVSVAGEVAWAAANYASKGSYNGNPVNSAGTETMVLVKTADGWKIRHIHWSSHRVEAQN